MMDLKKENTKVSSFTYPVSKATENTTSFTPPEDRAKKPTRKWLTTTGEGARGLSDQRSNIELFCILTCYSSAQAIENEPFTAPNDADIPWIENISLWAKKHKELAKKAKPILMYWQKYGFALYHNVSSTTYKRAQATYTHAYKLSGAEKNIGIVLQLSNYLLGNSAFQGSMFQEPGEDRDSIVAALFGGNNDVIAGLNMIKAYYTRDYTLIDCKREKKRCKEDGSFPIGQY